MSSARKRILLVDDDPDFLWLTGNLLGQAGYQVTCAQDGETALGLFEREVPNLVLLDYRLPDRDGLQIAGEMIERAPGIPILIVTAYGEIETAVRAMKLGVYDYLTKPVEMEDLIFTIGRGLEKQSLLKKIECLTKVMSERRSLQELMGSSSSVKEIVHRVEKVAPTSFTVLIEGESGTGKELVARAIHDFSPVKDGPFVTVDCGAIPETLIESELFGYVKGAFTGAYRDKPGHFELADGGTLFLDEVGNLSFPVQQKLLRAIQERAVQRLGSKAPRPIDFRILAATNEALEKRIETGHFRSDLYYRLNEFAIQTPALRERREDIPHLARRFIRQVEKELRKRCGGISEETLISLSDYHWPGNVRELRNVIRQAVLLVEEDSAILPEHLTFGPHSRPEITEGDSSSAMLCDGKKSLKEIVTRLKDAFEKQLIERMIAQTKGNKSEAARRFKVDYATLHRKIRVHQIESALEGTASHMDSSYGHTSGH